MNSPSNSDVESTPRRLPIRLIIGAAIAVILVILVPAARWFIAISVAVGLLIAVILHFWHKYKPIKPEDVDNRPLKLD